MNWLQKTSQNMVGSPVNQNIGSSAVNAILVKTVQNILTVEDYHGEPGAVTQIRDIAGSGACEEVRAFGEANSEANSIASAIMRGLNCDGYPEAPGAPQQQQMMTPGAFPALGVEQEKPMSMPSTEIV